MIGLGLASKILESWTSIFDIFNKENEKSIVKEILHEFKHYRMKNSWTVEWHYVIVVVVEGQGGI